MGDSIINKLESAKLQVLHTAKIKGLKITEEEAERIRDTLITTIKEIRTVNKDRETVEFYIYKVDVEKAREWNWLPISPDIWTLLAKYVATLNSNEKIEFSEQRLETYIENTKNLIRKIQEGKINLREDFVEIDPFKFDIILLSYKDPYLRTRINKDTLLLHFRGGSFLSLWDAILIEQLAIITTKKVKEELDKKTRKMSEDKIKEKGIKLIIKYIIDKNPYHRFEYYRWSNILSDKRIKEYYFHFGIVPRIAFVLGKDSNGEKTIIELGELNNPIDLLKAFVRAAEVSREFERTFEEKEPKLPEDIYKNLGEVEKSFIVN